MSNDIKKTCFFCAEIIEGRKTLEHIVPNSLLGKLNIKEEFVTGSRKTQYSRIKVPAHAICNSEFGSSYESKALDLLEDLDSLYELLLAEELSVPMVYSPEDSATAILTTWLSKIYYGFFYYDFLTTQDVHWKENCDRIISHQNFEFVRSSYRNGHGFQLPSSLYVFETGNTETDLVTIIYPSTMMFKIGSLTLILCLCDGYLTKNYLHGEALAKLREFVQIEETENPTLPVHKIAMAEIAALRVCIPKTPKFIYSDSQIINMSLSTAVLDPDEVYRIDEDVLHRIRIEMLGNFNIELNDDNT